MTMLAPLATSAFSIRSTTDSLLTTEYLLNLAADVFIVDLGYSIQYDMFLHEIDELAYLDDARTISIYLLHDHKRRSSARSQQ